MNKAELINRIYHSWNDLKVFIASLTEEQMTILTDAAGWTVKDHLIHLAVWESSVDALLSGESCCERMGISPEMWRADDVDGINATIQQREKDRPLADVLHTLDSVHQQVIASLQSVTDDTLQQPMPEVQRETWTGRIQLEWMIWNTYEHYDEHVPWMDRIAHQR